MKLVLGTSPHVRHVAVLQSGFQPDPGVMYSFAPLGLLSLAAMLRRERPSFACAIYDLNRRILAGALPLDGRFYEAAARDLLNSDPDAVGLMTECDSYHHVLQICEAVKALRPDCAVILGGPHASAVARTTMEMSSFIDAIVIGEGELTLPELLDTFGQDRPVAGALVRGRTGALIEGGARELVEHLDTLPMPAYDLYAPDPGEEMFLEVGRGCPFKCTFCSTAPYWRRRHRVKSAERILSEVRLLQDLHGTTRVHFTHDLFTTNRAWVAGVCETLIAAGAPVSWTCSARTDTVDDALFRMMADAGCSAIYFGIESGSERMLREIRKAIPFERTWGAVAGCKAVGITPNVGFIVGFPTEDAASFEATFAAWERALRAGCRPAHVFAFCPFANSSIYPQLEDIGCSGHFVDLSLGEVADAANRAMVVQDVELFGAYYRPRLPDLLEGEPDAIAGADEFSPLVEATLAPSLALADRLGGLARVFERWLPWIRGRNAARRAGAHRISYGAPLDYAEFLIEALQAEGASREALAAAQLLRTSLAVAQGAAAATTMANHRSLDPAPAARPILLGSSVSLGPVLATLALEVDATPALAGEWGLDYAEEPTFLVWHESAPGRVRLLRVEAEVFELLRRLKQAPHSISDLIISTAADEAVPESPPGRTGDVLGLVEAAVHQGLLTIGE